MGFIQAVVQTIVKMIIVAVFAFAGILLGKVLKNVMDKRKEKKN